MSKVNPLIVFSNAYDCEPTISNMDKLPCDKLCVNYYQYPYNYLIGQKYFAEHPEYTHYIPLAPDLVPNIEDYHTMVKYVQEYDFDVYGPICNVDMERHKDDIALCLKLPELKPDIRRYKWLTESQRQYLLSKGVTTLKTKFNALCFPFIKRKIKLDTPFCKVPYPTDARPSWEIDMGYACDLAFCHYMDYRGIEILQDLRFKWQHIRFAGPLQVGKKESCTFLKKGNEFYPIEIDLSQYSLK